MATITKQFLSGSTNGQSILVTAITSGSANQVHTAVAGTSAMDEVYLYAHNSSIGATTVIIGWGDNGTTSPETASNFRTTIPAQSGRQLIADGRLINNSKIIYAYATTASVITLDGFVNNIV